MPIPFRMPFRCAAAVLLRRAFLAPKASDPVRETLVTANDSADETEIDATPRRARSAPRRAQALRLTALPVSSSKAED